MSEMPNAQPAEPAGGGWVTPQVPPRQSSPFRSAATRASWVVWLLIANAVVALGAVAISLWGKMAVAGFEAGDRTLEDLESFDALFAWGGVIQFAVNVAAAIAWLAWSSRTVDNEDSLGVGPSKYTPRMAIAWWFLPIANLIVPYLVHRDIYQRYHRGVVAGAGIVVLWWILYLGDNIFANVVGRIWMAAETIAEVQTGLTLYVVSDLVTAVSAIVAVVMVQRIQRRADVLATDAGPTEAPIPGASQPPDAVEPTT